VPWLHVRLDSKPKYYKHREYAQGGVGGGGGYGGHGGGLTAKSTAMGTIYNDRRYEPASTTPRGAPPHDSAVNPQQYGGGAVGSPATVCRSDGWPTTLRKAPTASTNDSAFVANKTQVRDGDRVTIVQPDAGGFTMVRASNSTTGYIKSQYVRRTGGIGGLGQRGSSSDVRRAAPSQAAGGQYGGRFHQRLH